jgi:hypothetical protein
LFNDSATVTAGANPDDDLAKIRLKRIPTGMSVGTFKLEFSDLTAVKVFKSDGSLLYKPGGNLSALTLNLASPSGYLSGLMSGDVDVWVEGIKKNPNLLVTAAYRDGSNQVVARDDVHMLLAEWTFVGSDGAEVTGVPAVWQDALLAGVRRPDLTLDGSDLFDSAYKIQIDGISSSNGATIRVASDTESSDYYDDLFVTNSSKLVSKDFAVLYSSADIYGAASDALLSSEERQQIRDVLKLNAVHNPGQESTLTMGAPANATDIQRRTLAADRFKITLENDLVNVGDHIRGTVTRTGGGGRLFVKTSDLQMKSAGYGVMSLDFDFIANAAGDMIISANGKPAYLYSGSSLVRVLPAGQAPLQWSKKAWEALRVNEVVGGVPGDPINRNRQISELYARMYNSNSAAFKWAGMAAHASRFVGDAMAKAEWWMKLTGDVPGERAIRLDIAASK